MDDRIAQAKRHGLIQEESKMPVRLSTKDQLRQMGINVNFSDANLNDLDSIGNQSTGAADDDFDIEQLESDEDLADQDMFKGYNLFGADTKSNRKERTEAERRKWLNKDLFKNINLLAERNPPDEAKVTKVVYETRKKFRDISHRFSSKNDI